MARRLVRPCCYPSPLPCQSALLQPSLGQPERNKCRTNWSGLKENQSSEVGSEQDSSCTYKCHDTSKWTPLTLVGAWSKSDSDRSPILSASTAEPFATRKMCVALRLAANAGLQEQRVMFRVSSAVKHPLLPPLNYVISLSHQRSAAYLWVIATMAPWKSCRAPVRTLMVAASRWLLASSRSRKLHGTSANAASATLAFSPPLRTPEEREAQVGACREPQA